MATAALSSALNVNPVDKAVRAATAAPSAASPQPKQNLGTKLEQERDSARENVAKLVGEDAQYKNDQEMFKVQQQGEDAAKKAELIRQERALVTGSDPYKQLQETELSIAREQFHPTERSIGENLALAAATTIMGHMIGTGGKVPATITLAGMNGMMEGIRAGDLNRYKEQKQKFEDGLNNLVRKSQTLSKQLERITKLAATDKEEAYYEAQALFAKEGADFMAQHARQRGLASTLELAKASAKKAEETLAKYELEKQRREDRVEQARLVAGLREPKTTLKIVGVTPEGYGVYVMPDGTERVGTTKLGAKGKAGTSATGGLSSVIREATGLDLPAKDAAVVQSNVQGIRTIEGLQRDLQDPEITKGLKAKAASFFEKLSSLPESTDATSATNQILTGTDKTTLFLKKAMLSAYAIERAAIGGQRVTVQMMKQAGPVLDPTNYTGPAFNQLLDDRRQDLYSTLHDYGLKPQDIKTLSAQVPYTPYLEEQKTPTETASVKPAPAASATLTEEEAKELADLRKKHGR
jgi:hypothetical protein